MGAEGAGQAMAFRRARSSSGNANAEQARAALVEAFQSADLDRSGMIGKHAPAVTPLPGQGGTCPLCSRMRVAPCHARAA